MGSGLERSSRENVSGELREDVCDPDPIKQFAAWFHDARARDLVEPTAMTLATATADGCPSARTALLKSFDARGFVFFTNYGSRKARELAENPRATLLFWWGKLHRQVRIEGAVEKVSAGESDEYFASRPRGAQIGARASAQSEIIADRAALERRVEEVGAEFEGRDVPRPSYWGGYRLRTDVIEFWQGREDRLHDRLRYTRQSDRTWRIERLAP